MNYAGHNCGRVPDFFFRKLESNSSRVHGDSADDAVGGSTGSDRVEDSEDALWLESLRSSVSSNGGSYVLGGPLGHRSDVVDLAWNNSGLLLRYRHDVIHTYQLTVCTHHQWIS